MGLVSFDYDWIPGERPDGTVIGEAPKINTVLELKAGFTSAQGVVTSVTPDAGGISVLSIVVTECDDLQKFVDTLRAEEAVGVHPVGTGRTDGSIELFPPQPAPG